MLITLEDIQKLIIHPSQSENVLCKLIANQLELAEQESEVIINLGLVVK